MKKRHPLKIYLSVDVEPRLGSSINTLGAVPPIGHPSFLGIPFINNTLEQYHAKALYFVEALHHHYFGHQLLDYLSPFLEPDYINVGLHIHPAWLYFKDKIIRSDNCADFSEDELLHFINDGLNYLQQFSKKQISYFRSGNLSASNNLLSALEKSKFEYVSTTSLVYGSNLSNHYHAPYKLKKITDIPVTCFKRIGYKSQLWSITGVSSFETKALLQQAYHQDYDFVMIITHPFEFVTTKGKPLRGNQARLIHLCQYVKNNPDKFIFANDLNLLSVVSDKILKSNPLRYLKSLLESKIFEIY